MSGNADETIRDQVEVIHRACGLLADRYQMTADALLECRRFFDTLLDGDLPESVEWHEASIATLASDLTSCGDVESTVSELDGFGATKLFDEIVELKNELESD